MACAKEILGPLLLILYVNDLPEVCSKTKVILYADDTAILCKGKNIAQIQNTLNSEMSLSSDWFTQNKLGLHLNVSKTKSMLFGTSQRLSSTKDPDNFEIKVCDDVVERVQVFKYLSIHPRQQHSSGPPVAMSGKKLLVDHQRHTGENRRVGLATDGPPVVDHLQTM